MKIITRDSGGVVNGWLLPIWHIDDGTDISQVYLTIVAEGCAKGPHLHMKRDGKFTCIRGDVRIVMRDAEGKMSEHFSGESYDFATIHVPSGVASRIENIGDEDAYVLNMPHPPYRKEDSDECSVEDWDETF